MTIVVMVLAVFVLFALGGFKVEVKGSNMFGVLRPESEIREC